MAEPARVWVEVIFNVSYLVIIWALVFMMARRLPSVAPADQPVAKRFMWAFAVLAPGDAGHVFYIPVILWVGRAPMLGLLMIPKTCAYIAIAVIGHRALFTASRVSESREAVTVG